MSSTSGSITVVSKPSLVKVKTGSTKVEAGTPGIMGKPGPDGAPGSAPDVSFPAGATVLAMYVVRASGGNLYPVDTSVSTHAEQVVGVALQSTSTVGASVSVRLGGSVNDPGWSFSEGPVFCAASGALTQSPPTTGWLLQVGVALSATTVNINIEQPIHRG